MQRSTTILVLLMLLPVVASATSSADDTVEIRGEIVAVGQTVATQNHGGLDRLTIRTRSGQTRHLLLGEVGSCPEGVGVGDRIRARVMAGEPAGEPQRVRTLRVRGAESLTFRDEAGALVRTRTQRRAGSAAGLPGALRTQQQERRGGGGDRGGRPQKGAPRPR